MESSDDTICSYQFLSEIQHMMYAMGDCRRPMTQSAKLIEDIIFRTLRLLMKDSQQLADSRGEIWFGVQDLLFLLRKERLLLRRLIRQLKIRDLKHTALG